MDSEDSEPETPVILSSKPGKPNIAKGDRRSTPKSFKNSLIGNPGSRSDSPLNSDTDSISSSSSDSDSDSASGSESVYESEVDLDLDAGSDASPPDVLPATRAPELQPNTSNIICKYFKLGRCNKGAKCRFLHPKNKQTKTDRNGDQEGARIQTAWIIRACDSGDSGGGSMNKMRVLTSKLLFSIAPPKRY
ncbi:hypothetical protein AX774_g4732 [Zancudomyces culisetae]|uniref:C3H1-type domain-containing protein n=1 Tax=Zancudomyces culisetae TaxID=1213189 RepID=A0A1R1PLH1_ZANCU|nr:hypothetical protein AX774_g4936 [Zancudomyces culisetae]OMH81805.1 hypothetical protein AX774_g4732 [Zancudomyces culisetae]|eukprot:OMH81600.1 hypothetical protein AX774_g4936 [Zancudomyces culisetae]